MWYVPFSYGSTPNRTIYSTYFLEEMFLSYSSRKELISCFIFCHFCLLCSTLDLERIYKGFPARVGYIICEKDGKCRYVEDPNSGLWSFFENKPNAYRISQKSLQSHGQKGRLIYQLDDNVSVRVKRDLTTPTTGRT